MIAELVCRAKRGDAEAYTELVRRFQDAVYAAAYQAVLDQEVTCAPQMRPGSWRTKGNQRRPAMPPRHTTPQGVGACARR